MRILGIDPGTQRAGWGLIENNKHLGSGVITAPARWPVLERLYKITMSFRLTLCELLDEHDDIDLVAIEDQYCGKFPKAVLQTRLAAGAFMAISWEFGFSVEFYTPTDVKCAVCSGRAKKGQVAQMVSAILGLPLIAESDRADALAVALCAAAKLRLDEARKKEER